MSISQNSLQTLLEKIPSYKERLTVIKENHPDIDELHRSFVSALNSTINDFDQVADAILEDELYLLHSPLKPEYCVQELENKNIPEMIRGICDFLDICFSLRKLDDGLSMKLFDAQQVGTRVFMNILDRASIMVASSEDFITVAETIGPKNISKELSDYLKPIIKATENDFDLGYIDRALLFLERKLKEGSRYFAEGQYDKKAEKLAYRIFFESQAAHISDEPVLSRALNHLTNEGKSWKSFLDRHEDSRLSKYLSQMIKAYDRLKDEDPIYIFEVLNAKIPQGWKKTLMNELGRKDFTNINAQFDAARVFEIALKAELEQFADLMAAGSSYGRSPSQVSWVHTYFDSLIHNMEDELLDVDETKDAIEVIIDKAFLE